jgi:hypothetical protein
LAPAEFPAGSFRRQRDSLLRLLWGYVGEVPSPLRGRRLRYL